MADLRVKSAIARLSALVPIMNNFADRIIWAGDYLDIPRGTGSVSANLIYLDAPFNSNRNYSALVCSAAVRTTPDGC